MLVVLIHLGVPGGGRVPSRPLPAGHAQFDILRFDGNLN
jgi:hypothetical protein